MHVLGCALRWQDAESDERVEATLCQASKGLSRSTNANHTLLLQQMKELQGEARAGRLNPLHQQLLDRSLRELLDIQGRCERIKNTLFPRGYGYIAERLIMAFSVLFPLAVAHDLGWASVPMTVMVCSAVHLTGEAGRVLEDPFTLFWSTRPLSALSTTIERNLRERLGEYELPPDVKPQGGVLM